MTDRKNAAKLNHTNMRFGHIKDFDCVAGSAVWSETESKHRPLWGRLHFRGSRCMLQVPGQDACIALQFDTPGELRRARAFASEWSAKHLPATLVEPLTGEGHRCKVRLMAPTKAAYIEGLLFLKVADDVLEELRLPVGKKGCSKLFHELSLNLPVGALDNEGSRIQNSEMKLFLVRKAPNYFAAADSSDSVAAELLLSAHRDTMVFLRCTTEEEDDGTQYLLASEVSREPYKGEGSCWLKRVHFVHPCRGIEVIPADQASSGGAVLSSLVGESSPLLNAWNRYYEVKKRDDERMFRRRLDHDLVFRDPRPGEADGDFRIRIQTHDAIPVWLDKEDPDENRAERLDATVEIYNETNPQPQAKGILKTLSKSGEAVLTIDDGGVPGECGSLRAYKQKDIQDANKQDAMKLLLSGGAALQGLLDILSDPSSAPPTKQRTRRKLASNFNPEQLRAIERACGNESLMAIQGPPGTGKTRVIVEIITRLFDEAERQGNPPPRILLSSTQNEAVNNVISGLKDRGYLLHHIMSKKEQERQRERTGAGQPDEVRALSEAIAEQLKENPYLLKQSEQLGEIQRALDFMRSWPEGEDAALDALDTLLAERAFSSWIYEVQASYITDAKRYYDEIKRARSNGAPVPDVESADADDRDVTEDVLEWLRNNGGDELDAGAFKELLLGFLDTVKDPALEGLLEDGIATASTIRRAQRNEDHESAHEALLAYEKHLAAFSSQDRDATPTHRDETEDRIISLLGRLQVWKGQMIDALESMASAFDDKRVSVLQQWRSSLEDSPQEWERAKEKYSQLVAATCQKAASIGLDKRGDPFDYVIVDEAGRSEFYELIIPIIRGKRILLVGDQKQLPPMVEHDILLKMAEDGASSDFDPDWFARQSLFGELHASLPEENSSMLNIQYRSHPDIGDAISSAFYRGKLMSGPPEGGREYADWLKSKTPSWGLCDNKPLVWIDTDKVVNECTDQVCTQETSIAIGLANDALSSVHGSELEIGLISFYSKQLKDIQNRIVGDLGSEHRIVVGTVDSFQGKEFPLVILCCSRHDPGGGRVGFLHLPNRVLVALSRAKAQLIIVGSRSTLLHKSQDRGSGPMKDFITEAGDSIRFIPAEDTSYV